MTLHDLFLVEDALRLTCRSCGHSVLLVCPTKRALDRHVETHRCRTAA